MCAASEYTWTVAAKSVLGCGVGSPTIAGQVVVTVPQTVTSVTAIAGTSPHTGLADAAATAFARAREGVRMSSNARTDAAASAPASAAF